MAETATGSEVLAVRLVTPDRVLLDATAAAVELPAMSGYIEALYGHAPLLAELGAGEVRLHGGTSGDQKFFVAWGFVEVLPERVTVLAQIAERAEDIDRERAERAKQRAQERLAKAPSPQSDMDFERARIAMMKSLIRLQVATRARTRV